jgi:hypothetical protein
MSSTHPEPPPTPATPASDDELDALVRAAAAAAVPPALEGHPDPDELADYCLQALPLEEMDRLADHLAACASCAQVVLDLMAILTAGPGAGTAAAAGERAELDRQWERLAPRLQAAEPSARRALPPGQGAWALALAASLLLSAGLLAWGVSQHRQLAQTGEPRADVAFLGLEPLATGERSGGRLPPAVPAAGATIVLQLDLADFTKFPRYGMELRAPDGSLAWQTTGALQASTGQFVLEIPRRSLTVTGTYHVVLSGLGDREPVRLAEYAFAFTVPAPQPPMPGAQPSH